MNKNIIIRLFISTFFILSLVACNQNIPETEPLTGYEIVDDLVNHTIIASAPKSVNSYIIGKPIVIEIRNLSDQEYVYRSNDIQIFQAVNNEWIKVPDLMKTGIIEEDFSISDMDSEVNDYNSYIVLAPKGKFPDDNKLTVISPKIINDNIAKLRILVFAYPKISDNKVLDVAVGSIDIYLHP